MATRRAPARTYSMLLMSASCVSGVVAQPAATGAGILRTVAVTCSSSRTMRRPASAICRRSRATRTFSSRSSSLTSPRRAARMNEFSCAGSFSVHGAWRARKRNVANAIRRPAMRCSGTGTRSRGRCAPANDRYGAVDRYTWPPWRQHARALAQVARRVLDVLDHRVRQNEIERAVLERQRHAVGERRSGGSACRARDPA